MSEILKYFDALLGRYYTFVYQYAFLVSCNDTSAKDIAFQTYLYTGDNVRKYAITDKSVNKPSETTKVSIPDPREIKSQKQVVSAKFPAEQTPAASALTDSRAEAYVSENRELLLHLFANCNTVIDDFFLRHLRRRKSRSVIESSVDFAITDRLWALMRAPLLRKQALYLLYCMDFTEAEVSTLLHIPESRLPFLSPEDAAGLKELLKPVQPDEETLDNISDDLYLRFEKRNVPLENKLRDIRLFFDRHILWIAGFLILFMLLAAMYTSRFA
ncbi:MAG: hypothetical protein PUA70_01775 [Oribacterium sp.]|nr:hypothetical protein [Oribacterium sp.]